MTDAEETKQETCTGRVAQHKKLARLTYFPEHVFCVRYRFIPRRFIVHELAWNCIKIWR